MSDASTSSQEEDDALEDPSLTAEDSEPHPSAPAGGPSDDTEVGNGDGAQTLEIK